MKYSFQMKGKKMKKEQLSMVVLLLCWATALAQENAHQTNQYAGQPIEMRVSVRLEDAKFYIYNPPYKAKAIYGKMSDAKCLTPEELVESIKSETNQVWADYNNLPGEADIIPAQAFENRKKLDKNTNYYVLIDKLSFSYNGIPTAIIKYYFVDDGKRTILASMVVQKKDGRWFRTAIAGLEHLEAVVNQVKSENLAAFFDPNVSETASFFIKNLRKNVLDEEGVLDSEKLYAIIMKLNNKEKLAEFLLLNDK
jgi:hypothetical protein